MSKKPLVDILENGDPGRILYFWRCFAGGCLYVAPYRHNNPGDDEWIEVVW